MVVNGRLTKVNERAGSLQGQRMRVRVRQHVVGRLSVAVHIQCVPAVCHRSFIFAFFCWYYCRVVLLHPCGV